MNELDPEPDSPVARRTKRFRPSRFLIAALVVAFLLIVSAAVRRGIRIAHESQARDHARD